MGTVALGALLLLCTVGCVAVRYSKARFYRHSGVLRVAGWCLGVAAAIFATWLCLRVDEVPGEAVPSGLGLLVCMLLLTLLRSRAPRAST
jgi:uncharacterized membrane protein